MPDTLIDATSLVGSRERIVDRLAAWQEAARNHQIGTLMLAGATIEEMRVVAEAVL